MEKVEKIFGYIFKVLFGIVAIVGTVTFGMLTITSIGKLMDFFMDKPDDTMSLLFTLVGPIGLLIIGALCLDMAKTLFDQEIRAIPIVPYKQNPGHSDNKQTLLYQGLSSTEKTNRFISRFIAIIVTFLVVEFSTIAYQYQNRPDATVDIILIVKALLSLIGAAVLLLMWSLFLKE
jgi:hypothetical protein